MRHASPDLSACCFQHLQVTSGTKTLVALYTVQCTAGAQVAIGHTSPTAKPNPTDLGVFQPWKYFNEVCPNPNLSVEHFVFKRKERERELTLIYAKIILVNQGFGWD